MPPLTPAGLPVNYPFKPDWEVTPREVARQLAASKAAPDSSSFLLVDCRGPDEWRVAHIEGAELIPLGELEKRADELETSAGSKDQEIVIHCHHGGRSLRAAATLRAMGFTNVKSMAGGIDLWAVDVDPAVARY